MLSNISWTLFFTVAGITGLLYYLFVVVVFYPKETLTLLLGKTTKTTEPEKKFSLNPVVSVDSAADDFVVRQQNDLRFQPTYEPAPDQLEEESGNESSQTPDILLVGSVADITHNLKNLIQVMADEKTDKATAQSLLSRLLNENEQVAQSKYRYAINNLILELSRERLGFDLNISEINSLWDTPHPLVNE